MGKFLKNKKSIYQCRFCKHRETNWAKMYLHLKEQHREKTEKGNVPEGVQAAVDMGLVRYHYAKKNKRIVKRVRDSQTRAVNNEPMRYKVQEIILPIYLRIPITLPSNVEIIQRPDDEENKE